MGVEEFDLMRLLIERGGRCDWADELCNLLYHGPSDLFEIFFERSGGWTALIDSASEEPRVDVNPITDLIWMGRYETLESQWPRGLDALLNIPKYDLGRTPLTQAAYDGDLVAAKWLLDRGADVNAHFEFCDSYTALDLAAHNLDVEMSRRLLAAGANPNFRHGYSLPLDYVARAANDLGRSHEKRTNALHIYDEMVRYADRFPRPRDAMGDEISSWPPKVGRRA
ncbi:ankyrin repeat domain-containing protein [Marivita sp.]|uniref:ankyrin repeat domain-containing protein n=1 Tax=Marivita sp. TaxID=2003365 RepID=UPI003B58FE63